MVDTRIHDIREQAAGNRRNSGPERKLRDLEAGVTTAIWFLAIPALAPLVFMAPSLIRLSGVTHAAGNDVFGSGAAMLLFATLAITPLVTITGYRWFVPLRRWYGIIFGIDVILDAIAAANDPAFGNSIQADLTGHTFLMVGLTMVLIATVLTATAWRPVMRWLGKYWKRIQAIGTYVIWIELGIHLTLLEGFGISHADAAGPDRMPFPVFHQRLYEYLACSIPLLLFRLPVVKRSPYKRWIAVPCIVLFLFGYVLFLNELMYKGVAAFRMNPIND